VIQLNPSVTDNTTTYTATFYFTPTEVAAWGSGISNVKILKLNNAANLSGVLSSSDGVIVTPTVTDKLATDGSIAFTATFTGFSKFVLVEANTTLPVRLLDFTGRLNGNSVKLNWKTTAETNNRGFDIERSADGSSFNKIGWVDAVASSASINQYSFDDLNISKGNRYYYRLKQVDRDGNFSYSPVVNVAYLAGQLFTWYPNPVNDKLIITNSGADKAATLMVTDVAGKVLYRTQQVITGKFEINTGKWASGMYNVQIIADGEPVTFKVLKQ